MGRPTLAVTGATGHVGGLVAGHLAAAGLEQRLLVRPGSVARAPRYDGARTVTATYADAGAARTALEGVDVLLMVSASEGGDR